MLQASKLADYFAMDFCRKWVPLTHAVGVAKAIGKMKNAPKNGGPRFFSPNLTHSHIFWENPEALFASIAFDR